MSKDSKKRAQHLDAMMYVKGDVENEIAVQAIKWGYQEHPFWKWDIILKEELAEARTQAFVGGNSPYGELVQATAVLMSWLRDIKKNEIYKEANDEPDKNR